MQGFKKSLVALLAVAMVLSLVGPVFAAPADVEGTKYEDAVVRLMALGVFEGDPDGKFNPDNAISRAEAAAVVVRALGLRKSAEQMAGITKFADVNADPGLQWATGYINFAVSEGIVVGYPDGRFGGRDEVTYAQLAKMMLYAMKYGVTVEGGVWPNAVLAKADDLKLTEGMPVAANAPMPRGDVAKLVDNALDVPTMVQVSWGGTQMWQPSGDTLIKKLGYDEVEGQVFEVTAVNDSLRENQLRVDIAKVNKESASGTGKYDLIDAFKPGDYFGLDVKVWVNEDDKAVYIEPVTKEENVVYDRVDEEYKDKKVTLLVKDKGYEEHEDGAYVYINGKEGSFRNLPQNAFGKFVLKDNRVWFADVYELTGDGAKGAIVKGVDEENVRYIVNSDTEKKLRLGEADSYVLYKDGKEIALSDVEADDVLYWYKDGDDYVIFAASAKVEGKLEKARDTSVVIDGKKYDLSFDKTDGITTVSANEDDDVKLYAEANEMLKDLGGEEVVALLDLHGYVRHIRGDAVSTSTVRGVVLNWWKTGSGYVKVFTSKDETATYEFEKLSAYTSAMGGLIEGELYAVKLTLNADGEVKKAEVQDTPFAISAINKNGYLEFDTNKRIYVADSTVFIDAATDKDDPEIVSWDSVKDSKDLGTVKVLVLDKGNEANADAKLVVFTAGFDEIKPTSEKYALVSDKWDYRGDTMVELVTAGGDKEDFEAAGDTDFAAKGNMVVYRVNAKGQAVILDGVKKAERKQLQVTKIDGRWVDLSDNSKVRVASDAVVYDATSTSGKLVEGSFSDISIGDTIAVMKEWKDPNFVTNGQAKVVLITKFGDGEPVGGGGGEGEGTVTYIVSDYSDIFGRFDAEDKDGKEFKLFVADFDGWRIGDDDVSLAVMTAWLGTDNNADVGKVDVVTEDGKEILVVDGDVADSDDAKALVLEEIAEVTEITQGAVEEGVENPAKEGDSGTIPTGDSLYKTTIALKIDTDYDRPVKLKIEYTGENFKAYLKDVDGGNVWYENPPVWGPAEGFSAVNWKATTPVYFTGDPGVEYTITIKLVDAGWNNEIASETFTFTIPSGD